jgi:hypothetical protein
MHTMPRHELALEAEKILMVDVASTQAQAKEVAPPANHEGGGEAEVIAAKPPNASPSIPANGVDKMYH